MRRSDVNDSLPHEGAMKKATRLSILIVSVQLVIGVMAEAQQPEQLPGIGYPSVASLSANVARMEAFPSRAA